MLRTVLALPCLIKHAVHVCRYLFISSFLEKMRMFVKPLLLYRETFFPPPGGIIEFNSTVNESYMKILI